MIEILAPCGNSECLTAAVNTGADAVYLGLESFSARRNAENFSSEQLEQAVKFCHLSGVKVHVAINTLIFDSEIKKAEQALSIIRDCNVDAIIVQDFAIARLAKKIAPKVQLHASTQMTVTSIAGVKMVEEAGFSRAVLARELSLREIENITKSVNIETEVFVHGALCVCISGQCYMSAMLGGRSGNRGLCAQPCRLDFTSGERHNILSMKDVSLIPHLKELENIGVTSAKIEGRMKRPEYVAAVVTACRQTLAGETADMELLKNVFSRSGFTDGYYIGSYASMHGTRAKEDIASAPLLKSLHELYRRPYKRRKVDVFTKITTGKRIECTMKSGEEIVTVYGEIPSEAIKKSLTAEEVSDRMSRFGDTIFECGIVESKVESGLNVSAATLNELRRNAIKQLSEIFES